MQLRIWAEMVAVSMHSDLDDPPNTTMFARAGGTTPSRKKSDQQSVVAQAVTEAASAISGALSPRPSTQLQLMGTSPAKLIDSRSKLYKQLSELQSLRTSGVLTEEEYIMEKESIMTLLKQLNPTKCM